LAAVVDEATAVRRLTAQLFAALAGVALGLAALGVYGLMAYRVVAARREIGVRMALGAERARVTREVIGPGVRLAFGGAVVGLLGALLGARAITSMLYGVEPTDPVSYAGAAAALFLLALTGAYLPARRAARVDPSVVLRQD
jgi:ABC-type antimicrobial peptide transport system permease subunit